MPYYWSQIETLENLQYVAGLVDGFNQDRFLAAIMGKPLGKGKIVHMRNELNEITDKLEEEYLVLEEFGKTFNEKFAHDERHMLRTGPWICTRIRLWAVKIIRYRCSMTWMLIHPRWVSCSKQ